MAYPRCRLTAFVVMVCLACAISGHAQDPEKLTEDQMKDFLLNARVVKAKDAAKGITNTYRLTLSDGTITHDGSFQSVDETQFKHVFANGTSEVNFRDSYKFNIAAFELAKLLGLGDMMPVTVERRWDSKIGSLTWWLPAKLDEETRWRRKITPPDPDAWNRQMHKMRVFSQLVYDTDRNLGNVLISEDWHLWMIDFTRAFRAYTSLENRKNLEKCDRKLLDILRRLDAAEVEQKLSHWLSKYEIKGIMERRNKIVRVFDELIAKKGENEVLYD